MRGSLRQDASSKATVRREKAFAAVVSAQERANNASASAGKDNQIPEGWSVALDQTTGVLASYV